MTEGPKTDGRWPGSTAHSRALLTATSCLPMPLVAGHRVVTVRRRSFLDHPGTAVPWLRAQESYGYGRARAQHSAGDIRIRPGFTQVLSPVASAMCRHNASRAACPCGPEYRLPSQIEAGSI